MIVRHLLNTASKFSLSLMALAAVSVTLADWAAAHCQVPCGIYGDERRFEELLEDTETIAKAIAEIGTLAGTHDATGHNQLAPLGVGQGRPCLEHPKHHGPVFSCPAHQA